MCADTGSIMPRRARSCSRTASSARRQPPDDSAGRLSAAHETGASAAPWPPSSASCCTTASFSAIRPGIASTACRRARGRFWRAPSGWPTTTLLGPLRRGARGLRATVRGSPTTSACCRGIRSAERRLVGNFPQAFSHVALVNTAHSLMRRRQGPAHHRAGLGLSS